MRIIEKGGTAPSPGRITSFRNAGGSPAIAFAMVALGLGSGFAIVLLTFVGVATSVVSTATGRLLSDEDDCSTKEYGQFWKSNQLRDPSNPNKNFHLPPPRQECAMHPDDPLT